MKPEQALYIIKSILERAPMTPAELFAVNAALNALQEAIKPAATEPKPA